jgi:lambda repressor-like predicted transcriptional regulator
MNAEVDVPRILEAMQKNGWGIAAACVNLGVNNKTLKKILNGQVPKRLDAFYRVIEGLEIPIQEALIHGSSHQTPRLTVLPGRRQPSQVSQNQ